MPHTTKKVVNKLKIGPLIFLLVLTILLIGAGYWGIVRVAKLVNKPADEIKVDYQESASLPAKFPVDFPIYANAQIVSSWINEDKESTGISVIWNTVDEIKTIEHYYTSELVEKGWKITNQFSSVESSTISFEKGKYSGFIGITRNDKTVISVTVGLQK